MREVRARRNELVAEARKEHLRRGWFGMGWGEAVRKGLGPVRREKEREEAE